MDFNFYFNNLQKTAALDHDAYFVLTDTTLLIRVDHFLNKHYRMDLRELIEDVVCRYSQNRFVYFYFYDGGNPNISGFKEFLEYLQDQNNLDRDHTVVVTYQKTAIPNAVVLYSPISHFAVNTFTRLNTTPCLGDQFDHHFGCLLGRYDVNRIRLAKHLHDHHKDKTILSCHVKPHTMFFFNQGNLHNFFNEDLTWIRETLPLTIQEFQTSQMGSVNWYDAVDQGAAVYNQYFVDIISETDYNSPDWFTEKTFKPMMLGRPLILWSGRGALHSLHNLGFKTFDGFIDERYDFIYNNQERFGAVLAEVDRIAKIPLSELKQIHNELQPIFEHNRNQMFELWKQMDERPWKCWQII